ncbi:TPM domain-containing protein [Christensenellaceae bacterium OttesenSCG-928-M15]|nr:TPM domain-containing protein [Christensenellaceae bacterium OttesenSCG-928-M15]
MKKMIAAFIAVLSFALVFAFRANAADLDLVTDLAGVLSEDAQKELNDLAESILEQHQCEISVFVVDDMGEGDAYDMARFVYKEYGYGYGTDKSGLMLFISMAQRDCALIAHGYGNKAFTDHGKDVLLDRHVLPLLSKEKYYAAFTLYLGKAAEYLEMAESGAPFDVNTDEAYQQEKAKDAFWGKLAATILVPLLIAGLICFIFLRQMKTAVPQQAADHYIPDNGFVLTKSSDTFLFKTETRTTIEEKESGGTTVDKSGFSGTTRKF